MNGIAAMDAALLPGLPPFGLEIVEDTPEVVIDLRRVQRNIARAAATAAEDWRKKSRRFQSGMFLL